MPEHPTIVEMQNRLAECKRHFGGTIPNDAALAWDGYFAALLEWGLISVADHAALMDILPHQPDSPVMGLFLGWERDLPKDR